MAANYPWSEAFPGYTHNPWEAKITSFRRAVRVTGTEYDMEIQDLVDAACADLSLGGIIAAKVYNNQDPLINRAITLYVKSQFGWDNPDSEKYMESYQVLRRHLQLSSEYIIGEDDTSSGSSSGSGLSDGPTIIDPGLIRP